MFARVSRPFQKPKRSNFCAPNGTNDLPYKPSMTLHARTRQSQKGKTNECLNFCHPSTRKKAKGYTRSAVCHALPDVHVHYPSNMLELLLTTALSHFTRA